MKCKLLLGICILFFVLIVVNPVHGITKTYEVTSVSRIVGDNPEDLITQLDRGSLNLVHATSYVNDKWNQWGLEDTNKIITEEFPGKYKVKEGSINWNEVNSDINSFSKNELFVLSPDYNKIMNYEGLIPSSISWDFRNKEPLMIFDAQYAGLYLPKKESFVQKLSKYSTIIAPLSYSSKEMVKSIVCNLRSGEQIGESFRQARNNYYWGTEANEPIGLTMLSYELYGDPTTEVYLPNYQKNIIDRYCSDYNKNYTKNSDVERSMLAGANNNLKLIYEIDVGNYGVDSIGEYNTINFDNAVQKIQNFELVLPQIVHTTEFPLKTIVTGFGAEFLEPVNLNADIAEWQEGLKERNCYEETKEEYSSFAQSFTRDRNVVLAYLNPVEVTNCSTGNLILYKKIKYWIDYVPYSNILIKDIKVPGDIKSNSNTPIYVDVDNLGNNQEYGKLVIKDKEEIIGSKDIDLNSLETKKIEISMDVPEYEGTKVLDLIYEKDGLAMSQTNFNVQIIGLVNLQGQGTNSCCGENFDKCLGNNLMRNQCINGICVSSIEENHYLCSPSICEGVECKNTCDGATRYEQGSCVMGKCVYKTVIQNHDLCTTTCINFSPESCYDQGKDYHCGVYMDEKGNVIGVNTKFYEAYCDLGRCIYNKIEPKSPACGYDPCKGVDCSDKCGETTRYEGGSCLNGQCVYNLVELKSSKCGYDPCAGVDCSNKCDGFSYYSKGVCSNGQCQYNIEGNSKSCGYVNPCENVNCSDKCDGTTKYKQGSCVMGKCVYNIVEQKSPACGYDPCTDINCYDYCDSLKNLHSSGKCSDGKCSYGSETQKANVCITPSCKYIGDTDNDGKIVMADNLRILSVIGGKIAWPANICCYDIDKNKKIDIMDFIEGLKLLNGDRQSESSSLC